MSAVPVVAELVPAGRGVAARPVFGEESRPVPLGRDARKGGEIGDLVRLVPRGRSVRVAEIIGRSNDAHAVQKALVLAEGLTEKFPDAVEEEANGARLGDEAREDLREQEVVTIDPAGARDHDDAIFAEMEGDAVRLWVHIADVSHFVRPGGALDLEAARRGNSVYLPNVVIPMLPEALSADRCSLKAGEDRPAVTVEMLVAPDGAIRSVRFLRSLIRSRADLTYEDAAASLASGPSPALAAVAEAATRIRSERRKRGALEVGTREPKFLVEHGVVSGVESHEQGPAHRLVEDCMIAANEAVARHLLRAAHATAVFRHHPDPADSSIRRLFAQLEGLGIATPPLPDDPLVGSAARAAVAGAAAAAARSGGQAAFGLVLRALQRAHYSVTAPSHSGLASEAYLHFTSPIRRYPDLVTHRALLATLGRGDSPAAVIAAEAAEVSSATEREAAGLERRADRIFTALMVDARRGSVQTSSEVVGLIPGGAFVLTDEGWEGFVPSRWLADDFFHRDELEIALVGERSGHRVTLGDRLPVRVVRTDAMRGRVDLELTTAATASRRRPRGRR